MDIVSIGQAVAAAARKGDVRYQPRPTGQSAVAGGGGARRATLVLSSPTAIRSTQALDWLQRTLFTTPATTTRWRVRVANRQLSTVNQALTTPAQVSAVYVGTPIYAANGRWTGSYTSTPTQALAGTLTVPTDGSDVVSPWVTASNAQFQRNQPLMVSFGVSTTNSGTGIAQSQGGQTCAVTTSGSSLAGTANIAGNSPLIGQGFSLLDVRIEVEFFGSNGIIVVIGDSTSEGVSGGDLSAVQTGANPTERWPELAGLYTGNFVTNLGLGSSLATGVWATAANYCYSRIDWSTCAPDAAICSLGINDQNGGVTIANLKSALTAVRTNVLGLAPGIPFWLTTILPTTVGSPFATTLAATMSSGSTTFSSTASIPTGQAVQIGQGALYEVFTTTGTPSGTGPYTVTVTAASTRAHSAGDIAVYGKEYSRQQVNEWIRSVPSGVAGVFDFDALMSISPGGSLQDPRFVSADGIHPWRAGYQRMAREARLILR